MNVAQADRDLNKVVPELRDKVSKLLSLTKNIDGWEAFVTEGFRSNERQNWLYAQGRTRPGAIVTHAKAGQSDHNFGRAVDIAFKRGRQASWNPALYLKIVPIAKSVGLKWGGEFPGFKDMPHFYI